MTSAPLQYESLKTVIQYLEPNLRFKLSQRNPSVRLVEKAVPLTIRKLTFESDTQFTVNDTNYRIGLYRDYPDTVPLFHQKRNNQGGLWFDLDQWGFDDYSGRETIIPGDVVLARPEEVYNVMNGDDDLRHFEQHVDFYKKAIADRLKKGEELIDLPEAPLSPDENDYWFGNEFDRVFENTEEKTRFEKYLMDETNDFPIGRLQHNLQMYEECLQSFYCRRDNTPTKFIPKLQLTVTTPEKTDIYRYNYTMKVHEAMKSMCAQLFGSRRCAISVNAFDIMHNHIRTLRLPVGLKLQVQRMRVRGTAADNYESLKEILDGTSFPLDVLALVNGLQSLEHCDHEMVQGARALFLSDNWPAIESYLPIFLKLRKQFIHVEIIGLQFPVADQITLIQDWLYTGRPAGHRFSYMLWHNGMGTELMNQISELVDGAVVNGLSATILMPSGCRLLVTCDDYGEEGRNPFFNPACKVVLEVEEAE